MVRRMLLTGGVPRCAQAEAERGALAGLSQFLTEPGVALRKVFLSLRL